MANEEKTLWLLECWEKRIIRLYLLHATNQEDAETQANTLLAENPQLRRDTLRACPNGFTFVHETKTNKGVQRRNHP